MRYNSSHTLLIRFWWFTRLEHQCRLSIRYKSPVLHCTGRKVRNGYHICELQKDEHLFSLILTETKYGRQKRMWTFFRSGTRKHFFNVRCHFRWQLTSNTPHLRHRHDILLTRSTVSSLGGISDPRERRAYLHDEHFSTNHLPPHVLSASLILAVCRTNVTYQPIMAKLATSLPNSSVIKPSADRCAESVTFHLFH